MQVFLWIGFGWFPPPPKQQQQLKGETYSVRTFNTLAEQYHDSNIHLQPMK